MRRFGRLALIAAMATLFFTAIYAYADRSLETKYATIRFMDDLHVNDFLWRITGSRIPAGQSADEPAKSRVDELVERVESLMDVYPPSLHFTIEITPAAGDSRTAAHYDHERRRLYVSPTTVTDGMLAHEIAHAVICAQFSPPPPEKAQEILARFVDEN